MFQEEQIPVEHDPRTQVLPEYWSLYQGLMRTYNENPVKREYFGGQCLGGYNFVRTLELTIDRTKDAQAVRTIYETLKTIVDFPSAGSVSWEMRRFIRRAPPYLITEFGRLIKELAEVNGTDSDEFRRKIHLNMDFFYCDAEWRPADIDIEARSRKELDNLRDEIKSQREKHEKKPYDLE